MSNDPEAPWVRDDIEPLTHITGNEYRMNWRTVWIGTDQMSVRLHANIKAELEWVYVNQQPVGEKTVIQFTPDMQFSGDTPDD